MELPRVAVVLAAEEEQVALRPVAAAAAAVAEEEDLLATHRPSLELPRVAVAVLAAEKEQVALCPAAEEEDLLAALHLVVRPGALHRLLLSHHGPPA